MLLVLLYHHDYLNSGWLGVDIFFVISGYLITTILRKTREDKYYWQEFWTKRVTRIFPPFLLLLALTFVLFPISTWSMVGYVFSFGDLLAYTSGFEALRPLWSLAVEEHFYIVWPFAVRLLARQTLLFLLTLVLIAEPLLRLATFRYNHDWQLTYFLSPFRLDGLALGSILALLWEAPTARRILTSWSGPCLVFGIAAWSGARLLLGQGFTRAHASAAYISICYTIIAFSSAFLVAYLLTHPNSGASRLFGSTFLSFFGRISYGLYLYQVFVREVLLKSSHLSVKNVLWFDLPITLLASWLSFRYFEEPLIVWGKRLSSLLRTKAELV